MKTTINITRVKHPPDNIRLFSLEIKERGVNNWERRVFEPLGASRILTLTARFDLNLTDADLKDVANGHDFTIKMGVYAT